VLPPDAVVARVAARQRNLVTFAQLLAAGLSRNAVAHRVRTGRLHRVLHAVYAVGTPFLAPPRGRSSTSRPRCRTAHSTAR
jgi:Transcriptional regulator, AbiEi antitoxin